MKVLRAHDIPTPGSKERQAVQRTMQAIEDYSGEICCAVWEAKYPEFVGLSQDELFIKLRLRQAAYELARER